MARDYAKLIGHLIAKAESAQEIGHEEEAKAYRLKAEELMREYRISEEETIAQDQFSVLPKRFEVVLQEDAYYRSEFSAQYRQIWHEVARHAGVSYVLEYRYPKYGADEDQDRLTGVVAVGYGYEIDVRLAELLWTAARLVFMTRIDAKVNPELSDAENCYYLRNSGMPRNEIAEKLWGSDRKDGAAHGKVQKLYLAECARRGEDPKVAGRGIQVGLYRQAYADAFVNQFGWRLREARDAADSAGGVLELKGRKERVAEALYAEFPDSRPMSAEEREELRKKHQAAIDDCPACKTTKSKSGKCKYHRPRYATAEDYRRWDRQENSPEARAGRRNGAAAANAVNISRTAGERTQRAEARPDRPALGG